MGIHLVILVLSVLTESLLFFACSVEKIRLSKHHILTVYVLINRSMRHRCQIIMNGGFFQFEGGIDRIEFVPLLYCFK